MEAEKIIDDLCLIDNVVVNYSQGRRRGCGSATRFTF
jgi:hypothetical protein